MLNNPVTNLNGTDRSAAERAGDKAPERPFADVLERLKTVNLRPTRQRMALARLLFENGDRHVTAESLHSEAQTADIKVSLATIYNTLHQFTNAGLLREVVVEQGRSYFDTNTQEHHHFFFEDSGQLMDIDKSVLADFDLPEIPEGMEVRRVDVIVRIGSNHGRR